MTKKDKYWIGAVILIVAGGYLSQFGDNEIIKAIQGIFGLLAIVLIFTWLLKGDERKK